MAEPGGSGGAGMAPAGLRTVVAPGHESRQGQPIRVDFLGLSLLSIGLAALELTAWRPWS